ncbi:acyl-CoA oxidase [Westerdykella ornata]|uniref:Acyl-coenzyme A oxidase n=1 Tax=Westerdykella ornata TaxID=318751 RepID=A0A6A6JH91_WESOR|nr:acyl-CoA oxidase [Westerdykella ornata]KAF2275328.1 acyl-CoA oxidase [Westerdykella ornata]
MAPVYPESASGKAPNRQIQLMQQARDGASFDSYELACFIHGGENVLKERRLAWERVETLIGTRDTSKLPQSYGNQNREEMYEEGLRWGKIIFEDGLKFKHTFFKHITPRYVLLNSSPFAGKIIGAYCSTELGHGTFVRGMETTATFDPETDEFVINSPSVSSAKFWPGAIGFSCTHAIVTARLIIKSVDHGPHFFMMQFRSLEDGTPLPGITLGDVGLKMSYNGTCNGYAYFKNVRVPRVDMLSRHAQVARDGSYTGTQSPQVAYATLLMVRGIIVRSVGFQLAQAATIAARYSVVREQGLGPNGLGTSEAMLISYKSQHFRVLTLIAKAYAILFAAWSFEATYKALREEQENGNHTLLSYAHSAAAGFKAWSTQTAADGAEDARKCCGGQGYLIISGLPEIAAAATATATFEGENYVLWQQVGRFLFKVMDALKQGKDIDGNLAYLQEEYAARHQTSPLAFPGPLRSTSICEAHGQDFLQPDVQLLIYRKRAFWLIESTYLAVRGSKRSPADAWNEHMLSIISAARAHTEYEVLSSFIKVIRTLPPSMSPALKTVLTKLCALFALSNIVNPATTNAITFLECGYLSADQVRTIRSLVNELLEQLLPDVISLTDAWDFTDASLCSALGMRDGNVYENIMRWVEQVPINQRAWKQNKGVYQPGWNQWIDPVLKAKL